MIESQERGRDCTLKQRRRIFSLVGDVDCFGGRSRSRYSPRWSRIRNNSSAWRILQAEPEKGLWHHEISNDPGHRGT